LYPEEFPEIFAKKIQKVAIAERTVKQLVRILQR